MTLNTCFTFFLTVTLLKSAAELWDGNLTQLKLNRVQNGCCNVQLWIRKENQFNWLQTYSVVGSLDARYIKIQEKKKQHQNLQFNRVPSKQFMLTMQAIETDNMNYLEVGNLLQFCLMIVHVFLVSYVRKQANQVTHFIARVSYEVNCFHGLFSPPQFVLKNFLYDASKS